MKIKLPPGEALEVVPGDGGQSILRLFNGSHATDLKFPATTPAQGQTMVADGSGGLAWQYIPTIPDQTGQSGKVLTTNGSTLSWATQNGGSGASLPDQKDQGGKVLSTDGTNLSWVSQSGGGSGPAELTIEGPSEIIFDAPGSAGNPDGLTHDPVTYSVPVLAGATYSWTVKGSSEQGYFIGPSISFIGPSISVTPWPFTSLNLQCSRKSPDGTVQIALKDVNVKFNGTQLDSIAEVNGNLVDGVAGVMGHLYGDPASDTFPAGFQNNPDRFVIVSDMIYFIDSYVVRSFNLVTKEFKSYCGKPGYGGNTDGVGTDARLQFNDVLVHDGLGGIYVFPGFSSSAGLIRKVDLVAGSLTTVMGVLNATEQVDGTAGKLTILESVCEGVNGKIYILDRKPSSSTVVLRYLDTQAAGGPTLTTVGVVTGLDFGSSSSVYYEGGILFATGTKIGRVDVQTLGLTYEDGTETGNALTPMDFSFECNHPTYGSLAGFTLLGDDLYFMDSSSTLRCRHLKTPFATQGSVQTLDAFDGGTFLYVPRTGDTGFLFRISELFAVNFKGVVTAPYWETLEENSFLGLSTVVFSKTSPQICFGTNIHPAWFTPISLKTGDTIVLNCVTQKQSTLPPARVFRSSYDLEFSEEFHSTLPLNDGYLTHSYSRVLGPEGGQSPSYMVLYSLTPGPRSIYGVYINATHGGGFDSPIVGETHINYDSSGQVSAVATVGPQSQEVIFKEFEYKSGNIASVKTWYCLRKSDIGRRGVLGVGQQEVFIYDKTGALIGSKIWDPWDYISKSNGNVEEKE